MPTSYLTHFSISGETLALINSAMLPASAFTNRNLESIFNPETPTASVWGGWGACSAMQRVGRHRRIGTVSLPAPFLSLSWLVLLFTGVI